jgi:hypothetical protein
MGRQAKINRRNPEKEGGKEKEQEAKEKGKRAGESGV